MPDPSSSIAASRHSVMTPHVAQTAFAAAVEFLCCLKNIEVGIPRQAAESRHVTGRQ